MANPFDDYDKGSSNPFDQHDAEMAAQQATPAAPADSITQHVVAGKMGNAELAQFYKDNPDLDPSLIQSALPGEQSLDWSKLKDLFQMGRTAESYPLAAIPAAWASVTGPRTETSPTEGLDVGTQDVPTTYGSRFGKEYARQQQQIAQGNGLLGGLASPTNLALLGLNALTGGASTPATVSRIPGLARWLGAIGDEAVAGGVAGAGISAADNLIDPTKEHEPVLDAMIGGGLMGGATGGVGQGFKEWGKSVLPGFGSRINMKVPEEAKKLVHENRDPILSRGFFPQTREGMMRASEGIQSGLGVQYTKATKALEEAQPDLLFNMEAWKNNAQNKLTEKLGDWGEGLLERDPTSLSGHKLPQVAVDAIDKSMNAVRANKSRHTNLDLGEMISAPPGVNRGTTSLPAIVSSYGRLNPSGGGVEIDNLMDALSNGTVNRGGASVTPPIAKLLKGDVNDIRSKVLARALEKDHTKWPELNAKVEDAVTKSLTPTEFGHARNLATDPIAWQDPVAEAARLKRYASQSNHDAANEMMMHYPEYKDVLVNPAKGVNVPKDYALESSLQNLLKHPGFLGLTDRANILGLFNPAVSPWFKASTLYKAGGLTKALGLGTIGAGATSPLGSKLLDALRNKDSDTK